jgi:DNA segregation ATPase FtsK/SpoIIIE, S-DNA-T family
MAKKRSSSRRRKSSRRPSLRLPRIRLSELEQSQLDALGLGLVGLAVFASLVFYFGWEGGTVGGALADAIGFLFGQVAYLTPLVLLGAGAALVARPSLPEGVRPRAGVVLLLAALTLGFAAGTLGLGPDSPPRDGYFDPSFFNDHGGLIGETLYWLTSTLFQSAGAHIAFVFMLAGSLLLLTGTSVGRLLELGRYGAGAAGDRLRERKEDFARALAEERRRAHADAVAAEVQAYEQQGGEPQLQEMDELHEQDTLTDADPLEAIADEVVMRVPPQPPEQDEPARERPPVELTPMGERRSGITESEEIGYRLPDPGFLKRSKDGNGGPDTTNRDAVATLLVETLGHFGIDADVVGMVSGPRVTRYELSLAPGTKVSKVTQLKDDLAYALASTDIRILAPIPGKQAVGVEVPNLSHRMVFLGDIYKQKLDNGSAKTASGGPSPLVAWLGKDIAGKAVWADLARMPHLLVAGTTGAGKSGCINAMLSSILLRATPNQVRMVLVDPKRVELNYYEDIPHLLTPVVNVPRMAANVLNNLLREMENRYEAMGEVRARNIVEMNRTRIAAKQPPLPYILCVIDELADLMMIAPAEVEDAIIRLAQKSRAVGIHLVLATQRPSVDIITGTIKVNVPSRIAFAVSSQHDSRVILDQGGAEALLGQGDMLFRPVGSSKLQRIQGAYITEDEISHLTDEWRCQGEPDYEQELLEAPELDDDAEREFSPDEDDLLNEAIELVAQTQTASVSMLQRRLRVGYTRAGRLIDMLERRGVISGYEGSKPRQVLITQADVSRVLAGQGDEAMVGAPAPAPAPDPPEDSFDED